MQNEGKMRFLSILDILLNHADEKNPISTQQIIGMLDKSYGLPAHRTTVSGDIEIMQRFGLDIRKIESTSNLYYIHRSISIDDVRLLAAIIASNKIIPMDAGDNLIAMLSKYLSSEIQRDSIAANYATEGRLKEDIGELYEIARTINRAITLGKKISFKYFVYGQDKRKILVNKGRDYTFSPYKIIIGKDICYTIGFSDRISKIVGFKLNRFADVPVILEEDAVPAPEDFNFEEMQYNRFSGYHAKNTLVELECSNSIADIVFDRLGVDVETVPVSNEVFRVKAKVPVGREFLGWVFSFEGKMKILGPEFAKSEYERMLECALAGK